jgi:hypothetical protein
MIADSPQVVIQRMDVDEFDGGGNAMPFVFLL